MTETMKPLFMGRRPGFHECPYCGELQRSGNRIRIRCINCSREFNIWECRIFKRSAGKNQFICADNDRSVIYYKKKTKDAHGNKR